MIIDRISSVSALLLAANAVMSSTRVYFISNEVIATTFLFCAVFVEIISHGIVCYYAEVKGVHQKNLGGEYALVRAYLGSKLMLFFGCVSYEMVPLGILCEVDLLIYMALPGFLFRALANMQRLYACLTVQRKISKKNE